MTRTPTLVRREPAARVLGDAPADSRVDEGRLQVRIDPHGRELLGEVPKRRSHALDLF